MQTKIPGRRQRYGDCQREGGGEVGGEEEGIKGGGRRLDSGRQAHNTIYR